MDAEIDLVRISLWTEQELGVPPLIRLAGKAPLDRDWPNGPRIDPDVWRAKLVGHKGNVGALTGGGNVVYDFDLYKPEGTETYRMLAASGLLPPTVACTTGRGGLHLWYDYDPAEVEVGCGSFAGVIIPNGRPLPGGAEWKGDGGFVVVPPSVTDGPYIWEDGLWETAP